MRKDDGTIRKLRRSYNTPGHAHELTFSCYRRLPLLQSDYARRYFIEALDRARQKWNFEVWAYVLMPEHVHLLLFPRSAEYSMAAILKAVKQPVSRRVLRLLRKSAPERLRRLSVVRPSGRAVYRFWQQGGGYDRNICKPATVWASINYMHANPVRRGLVACAVDWPWSSAGWYAGEGQGKLRIDPLPAFLSNE